MQYLSKFRDTIEENLDDCGFIMSFRHNTKITIHEEKIFLINLKLNISSLLMALLREYFLKSHIGNNILRTYTQ